MSKNKEKFYYLLLSFGAGADMWDVEDEIKDVLGRYSDGSGCGFGRRDLSYYYKNLNSLKAAVRKVRSLPRRIKCEAWDYTSIDGEDYNFGGPKISLRGVR
jgi:hypothetical protein